MSCAAGGTTRWTRPWTCWFGRLDRLAVGGVELAGFAAALAVQHDDEVDQRHYSDDHEDPTEGGQSGGEREPRRAGAKQQPEGGEDRAQGQRAARGGRPADAGRRVMVIGQAAFIVGPGASPAVACHVRAYPVSSALSAAARCCRARDARASDG